MGFQTENDRENFAHYLMTQGAAHARNGASNSMGGRFGSRVPGRDRDRGLYAARPQRGTFAHRGSGAGEPRRQPPRARRRSPRLFQGHPAAREGVRAVPRTLSRVALEGDIAAGHAEEPRRRQAIRGHRSRGRRIDRQDQRPVRRRRLDADPLYQQILFPHCAFGIYRSADVAMVTPLRDGMNLVAKEFLAAQDCNNPGVLVLSQFAGAAKELDEALIINPYELDAVAIALKTALEMPVPRRRERHAPMIAHLLENDVRNWAETYLAALLEGAQGRGLFDGIRALFGGSSERRMAGIR